MLDDQGSFRHAFFTRASISRPRRQHQPFQQHVYHCEHDHAHEGRPESCAGVNYHRKDCLDIVTRLEAVRDRTLKYFELSDEQLARNYGPGKWPVRFILHHLADAETVLYDRIRRIISEPRQVLWAFDQESWAMSLDYSRMPLDLSRRIYDSVRAGVIHQARLHYESKGHLEFVHSETGIRTLKAEFDKVAAHNEHHLEQIALALQGS
jgi:hypothetical protein